MWDTHIQAQIYFQAIKMFLIGVYVIRYWKVPCLGIWGYYGTKPMLSGSVVDPDSLKSDPDPAFQVNPNPDPIWIQGFDDQKF